MTVGSTQLAAEWHRSSRLHLPVPAEPSTPTVAHAARQLNLAPDSLISADWRRSPRGHARL